jgi:hypothetical protein
LSPFLVGRVVTFLAAKFTIFIVSFTTADAATMLVMQLQRLHLPTPRAAAFL